MKFNVFSELSYEVFSPTTFIFNIQVASSPSQVITDESLAISPLIDFREFVLSNARFIKLEVSQQTFFTITYTAAVNVQHKIINKTTLLQPIPVI